MKRNNNYTQIEVYFSFSWLLNHFSFMVVVVVGIFVCLFFVSEFVSAFKFFPVKLECFYNKKY